LQRIGPAVGTNVVLGALGQVANHTPTTLGVASDPLFQGVGWCWANNIAASGPAGSFNVQTTIGVTGDLSPGGILNSPSSTLVADTTGLAETAADGGIAHFTTTGGVQNFLILVNPHTTADGTPIIFPQTDAGIGLRGLQQFINPRGIALLSIPQAFGLAPPPTSGDLIIRGNGTNLLGWFLSVYPPGRLSIIPVGLNGVNSTFLAQGEAP
jgi:hypothetical protein